MDQEQITNLNNTVRNSYVPTKEFSLEPIDRQAMIEIIGQDEGRIKSIKEDAFKYKYGPSEVTSNAAYPYSRIPTDPYVRPVTNIPYNQRAPYTTVVQQAENVDNTKARFKTIREKAYKEAEDYIRQSSKTDSAHESYTKSKKKKGLWNKVSNIVDHPIVSKAIMLFGVIALQTVASFLHEEYKDAMASRKEDKGQMMEDASIKATQKSVRCVYAMASREEDKAKEKLKEGVKQ